MTTSIHLQQEPIDVAAEVAKLAGAHKDIGAVVTFSGICRADENGEAITALTLEHYPGMAEAEIARHVDEAYSRWPLIAALVIHRYGRITPGETIVLVATASRHRQAAFAAAEFLMDYLKTRAPFWKQVEMAGTTAVTTTWVEAKAADDAAAERWLAPPPRRDAAK
jgi:molybdopterin synthase catalytic subunit